MSQIVLRLPVPPSLWELYGQKGYRKYITSKYRKWMNEADLMLWQQRKEYAGKLIEGATKVSIQVPNTSRADTDNLMKAPIDFLVTRKVTHDDREHLQVTCEKADVDCCIVTIEPCQVAA